MRNPFRRAPAEPEPPSRPLTPEQEGDLREVARELIRPGFTDRADVVQALEDHLYDEEVDARAVAEAAARIAAEEWATRGSELAAAEGASDYDRLAAAFDALGRQGVLARMSFTCCQTCGNDEIGDERTPLEPVAGSTYGFAEWAFTFFHQQDAERLVDPDATLYLGFGSFRPAADTDPAELAAARDGDANARQRVAVHTDTAVGRAVRDALVSEGLDVTWDDDPGARIEVAIRDWRKPLPVG